MRADGCLPSWWPLVTQPCAFGSMRRCLKTMNCGKRAGSRLEINRIRRNRRRRGVHQRIAPSISVQISRSDGTFAIDFVVSMSSPPVYEFKLCDSSLHDSNLHMEPPAGVAMERSIPRPLREQFGRWPVARHAAGGARRWLHWAIAPGRI